MATIKEAIAACEVLQQASPATTAFLINLAR